MNKIIFPIRFKLNDNKIIPDELYASDLDVLFYNILLQLQHEFEKTQLLHNDTPAYLYKYH